MFHKQNPPAGSRPGTLAVPPGSPPPRIDLHRYSPAEVRERIRAGIGPIRTLGPDYLAYALIDTLIDRYYPIVESLSGELEELEDRVVEDADVEDLARLHRIRRQLMELRVPRE